MRQTLHILAKDVRYLRWWIALWLAVVVGIPSVRGVPYFFDLLCMLGILLIARLVQAEPLPGDRQFWLTRPYSRKSLLAAKCLFLFVVMVVPMTVLDAVRVSGAGFDMWHYIPGLVWEQVLRVALVALPAMALAAIARNLTQQIFAVLGLMLFFVYSPARYVGPPHWWTGLDWIYNSGIAAVIFCCAAAIVLWQYTRRETWKARVGFVCGTVALVLLPLIPTPAAMAIQEANAPMKVDTSTLRVTVDGPATRARIELPLEVPLRIEGLPDGTRMWADDVNVHMDTDGRELNLGNSASLASRDHTHLVLSIFGAPALWYQAFGAVRLRVSALVTLGGNARSVAIPQYGPDGEIHFAIPQVGRCVKPRNSIASDCVFPFREPRVIFVEEQRAHRPSYSPFPAELSLDPVETFGWFYQASPDPHNGEPEIEDPVAHFRYDFDVDDVRLAPPPGAY